MLVIREIAKTVICCQEASTTKTVITVFGCMTRRIVSTAITVKNANFVQDALTVSNATIQTLHRIVRDRPIANIATTAAPAVTVSYVRI